MRLAHPGIPTPLASAALQFAIGFGFGFADAFDDNVSLPRAMLFMPSDELTFDLGNACDRLGMCMTKSDVAIGKRAIFEPCV